MNTLHKHSEELLLFTIIALRSTSLLFATKGLEYLGPLSLNGYRFPLAAFILIIIFHKELKKLNAKTVLHGSIIGFFFFLTMATEMIGLKMTNSSTTSFLENMAIILVPLINSFLIKKAPNFTSILSAIIAFIGVGLLTLKGDHIGLSMGEFICILSALAYTGSVLATDRYSKQDNPMMLGVVQVCFMGISSYLLAFFIERPSMPTSVQPWISIVFLAIICTCFGFTLQPVAQSKVSADTAGLFCAFNPLITVILGYIFLDERLGVNGLIGGAMILISIMVPFIYDKFHH